MKKLIELFISLFKIGAFTFGGGYAMIPLIAVILPSFFIILIIAIFFMQFRDNYYINAAFQGITAAVPILVLVGAISLSRGLSKNLRTILTIIIALIALMFFNIHPVLVVVISGVYGAIFLREKVS